MAIKKSIWIFFGILVISALVLGSAFQTRAETMNYKFYTWVIKGDRTPIGDVEGHNLLVHKRGGFCAFESGEVATYSNNVSTIDLVKGSGSFLTYSTLNFPDGSTITTKGQGTVTGGSSSGQWTSEIVKGTGRFEGIKGTLSGKIKYLPTEKEEAGPKGYGEGNITYTLPPK
jgi:hypothetical protein